MWKVHVGYTFEGKDKWKKFKTLGAGLGPQNLQPNRSCTNHCEGEMNFKELMTNVNLFVNQQVKIAVGDKEMDVTGIYWLRTEGEPQPVLVATQIPDFMNKKQFQFILKLYGRDKYGAKTLEEFLSRVSPYSDGYVGLKWAGMFIGIEKDGYAHS